MLMSYTIHFGAMQMKILPRMNQDLRKTSFNFERQHLHYKQMYAQILDIIIVHLETSFAYIEALQYFALVNYDNF